MDFGEILIYIVCYFGIFTALYFIITLIENRHNIRTPPCKTYPSVSVIVPAYNEQETIGKTIESLLALDYPKKKLQIIVVDDGSTDRTYDIAARYRGIEVYHKKNGGKASALNYGIERSKGEFVGALDADSFAEKTALKKIMAMFRTRSVMAVTPSLRVYKPESILQRVQMIEYLMGIYMRKIFSLLGSIHVTPGPFTIYRKEFFTRYGGYSENNLTEDIEVALRIQSHGFEIENSVDANIYTVSPYHFRPLLRQRLRWYLGFIENVYDYRHLFSPTFGNLGLIILPAAFISVILVIAVLFYTAYLFVDRLLRDFLNYQSIHFDLAKLFEFHFDLFYINLESYTMLTFVTLIIGIGTILIARRVAKEKEDIKANYVLYTMFYWFLFGFWWLGAIALKITGKRILWGQKKL